jgi:hypothetical protein
MPRSHFSLPAEIMIYRVSLDLTKIELIILINRGLIPPTITAIYLFLAFANF